MSSLSTFSKQINHPKERPPRGSFMSGGIGTSLTLHLPSPQLIPLQEGVPKVSCYSSSRVHLCAAVITQGSMKPTPSPLTPPALLICFRVKFVLVFVYSTPISSFVKPYGAMRKPRDSGCPYPSIITSSPKVAQNIM